MHRINGVHCQIQKKKFNVMKTQVLYRRQSTNKCGRSACLDGIYRPRQIPATLSHGTKWKFPDNRKPSFRDKNLQSFKKSD